MGRKKRNSFVSTEKIGVDTGWTQLTRAIIMWSLSMSALPCLLAEKETETDYYGLICSTGRARFVFYCSLYSVSQKREFCYVYIFQLVETSPAKYN